MRKPDFALCEIKDTDQLCSNCTADQRLCFRCRARTIYIQLVYTQFFKILAFVCDCTGWSVLDRIGNAEFSSVAAQIIILLLYTRVIQEVMRTNV